ncbi:MAG: alanine racemase [Chlorobiaceae bacterium]|nr:alanine racemase [Chlorobiaceae bacterium]
MPNAVTADLHHLSEAVISIDNLLHNLACIREVTGQAHRIMGIVKANAYGHGAPEITAALESAGVRDFGVANVHEAIELRQAHRFREESRILAFASPLPQHIGLYLEHGVEMTICDPATARAASVIAAAGGGTLRVQVKVDTGMGRLGVSPADAALLLEAVDRSPNLELAGVYTHFAEGHDANGFTALQLERFLQVTGDYESRTGKRILKHAASSGAIVSKPAAHLDMARPGILLYGCHPVDAKPTGLPVKPVMQFRSTVIYVKEVPEGASVSYNRTWTAPGPRRIATVAAGYADGFHRTLSNRAKVSIGGRMYEQAGTVTMDQIMVDLGDDRTVKPGDTAVLFGWDGPSAGEQAIAAGTISYELLCSVSRRVMRIFRKG